MPTLLVTPEEGLLDQPRHIVAEGFAAGQQVVLHSRTRRGGGVAWASSATFIADAQGRLDLERDAPVAGSYSVAASQGLLWSQQPEGGAGAGVFPDDVLQPLVTQLWFDGSEQPVTLVQRLAANGVSRREVRDHGLVGTLFTPPGDGPHPAVVVLNGSGGGINEPRAALYASHGYAALALGYSRGVLEM